VAIEGDFPAKRWFQVRLPLSELRRLRSIPSRHENCTACTVSQGATDDAPHTLIIDEIKIDGQKRASPVAAEVRAAPRAPKNVQAKGYDRHIDISWEPVKTVSCKATPSIAR